jgi:hypothetical protein
MANWKPKPSIPTKIQEGVALDMRSGCPKLIGWIDTGEENHLAKILKENIMKSTLATHVLQIMFVGYTGCEKS